MLTIPGFHGVGPGALTGRGSNPVEPMKNRPLDSTVLVVLAEGQLEGGFEDMVGDWEAIDDIERKGNYRDIVDTYHVTAEGFMNVVHGIAKSMEVVTCLPTLLQLPLQSAKDVIERNIAFPRGSCWSTQTTHSQPRGWHCSSPLRTTSPVGTGLVGKAERTSAAHASCGGVETEAGTLSFCPCGVLRILLSENAYHPGSDFVMNDRLVIFANDVNTKFL